MAPLYGAAFGFNTDRRVKPVHFATGFFVSLLGRHFEAQLLNKVVAFSDGKDLSGDYALDSLHPLLLESNRIGATVSPRELHILRRHLRCLANNDEAVFPAYAERSGFGCDYSTAASDILSLTKDNDGFAGHFVRTVLTQTEDGRWVLAQMARWLDQPEATLRQVFLPLLDEAAIQVDTDAKYERRFGPLDRRRVRTVAGRMAAQTAALRTLCENADSLVASETKLRFAIIGACLWVFRYLIEEALGGTGSSRVLLVDASGDPGSRMRVQSRWSYTRLREELVAGFRGFGDAGRFEGCAEAWAYVEQELDGRPKFEEFYRELALRSGLAQPRASRVAAKHFEPQADTLRVLLLSVLPVAEGQVPLADVLDRLFRVWGLIFGGRQDDADLLGKLGYSGLDQDHDLVPNQSALIRLLSDLGLATHHSDGLVLCHSETTL